VREVLCLQYREEIVAQKSPRKRRLSFYGYILSTAHESDVMLWSLTVWVELV
jgi:hypothetical protein